MHEIKLSVKSTLNRAAVCNYMQYQQNHKLNSQHVISSTNNCHGRQKSNLVGTYLQRYLSELSYSSEENKKKL